MTPPADNRAFVEWCQRDFATTLSMPLAERDRLLSLSGSVNDTRVRAICDLAILRLDLAEASAQVAEQYSLAETWQKTAAQLGVEKDEMALELVATRAAVAERDATILRLRGGIWATPCAADCDSQTGFIHVEPCPFWTQGYCLVRDKCVHEKAMGEPCAKCSDVIGIGVDSQIVFGPEHCHPKPCNCWKDDLLQGSPDGGPPQATSELEGLREEVDDLKKAIWRLTHNSASILKGATQMRDDADSLRSQLATAREALKLIASRICGSDCHERYMRTDNPDILPGANPRPWSRCAKCICESALAALSADSPPALPAGSAGAGRGRESEPLRLHRP